MAIIIDSPRFDICVTESPDYKGEARYLVRYGLEAKKRDTLSEAMVEFRHCLEHALQCEGINQAELNASYLFEDIDDELNQ